MRVSFLAMILLAVTSAFAAEPRVLRDQSYAEPKNERQTLDVYSPADGSDHPVVLWIHGGGWRQGDKRNVQRKPQAFVEKGFVFVSINYRFAPQVKVKEMTGDVAKGNSMGSRPCQGIRGQARLVLCHGPFRRCPLSGTGLH